MFEEAPQLITALVGAVSVVTGFIISRRGARDTASQQSAANRLAETAQQIDAYERLAKTHESDYEVERKRRLDTQAELDKMTERVRELRSSNAESDRMLAYLRGIIHTEIEAEATNFPPLPPGNEEPQGEQP